MTPARLIETGVELPDPGTARTVDELVERLRSLKIWAGDPSYSVITRRVATAQAAAGRPASELARRGTVVDCFKQQRRRLNSDLVIDVVRALHPDDGYVTHWQQALRVVGGETIAAAQVRVQDALPPTLAGFTGRTAELDHLRRSLRQSLSDGAAVAVTAIEGMAGVGKTELATHVGHLLTEEKSVDRVLFVNLRGFDPNQPPADPAAVLDGFLRRLGLSGQQIPHDLDARVAAYRDLLGGTRTLVVLDNAADADQVRPLLSETPGCPVLVTSRHNLFDLTPATHLTLDVFTPAEAIQLLARAARQVPVGPDPDAAARIGDRCGHLPLALALIVGHMRATPGWTLTDHAHRLDERHDDRRLDAGVEIALGLSYRHLPVERRRLLRLLALHPGQDFDAYAAAAIADTDLDTAQAHLRQLCGEHLLQQRTPGRYTFHDLIRAYATTRAQDEDRPSDRRAALTRVFDHYLAATAAAMDTLHPAEAHRRPRVFAPLTATPDLTDPGAARTWLDIERPTLVAVAAYTTVHGWPTYTTRLASTVFRYLVGGYHTDAVIVHRHAYEAARYIDDAIGQARALTDLSGAHWSLGRTDLAVQQLEQASELFRQAGDLTGEARVANNLGIVAMCSARYRTAADHYGRALTLYQQAGDEHGEALSLTNLGVVDARLGRQQRAIDHYHQALTLHRRAGDRNGEAYALNSLASLEVRLGRYKPGGEHFQQALMLYRQLGDRDGEADALNGIGTLHAHLGEPEQAVEYHQRALTIYSGTGDPVGQAKALNGLGAAKLLAGRPADALAHHTAAHTIAAGISSSDQVARAHRGLADAHRALNDPVEAQYHYHRAIAIYTDLGQPEADQIRAHLAAIDASQSD